MSLPYISLVVIFVLSGWAYLYISSQNNDQLIAKRHWIETIPNVISTLGVLGTFLGITVGLVGFDTQDLQTSIPQLLNGLKTAFFTSLAGMLGSLLLSKKVNNLYDEVTGGVSDINQAAASICQAVSNLQKASAQQANSATVFYNLMQNVVQQMSTSISNVDANINGLNVAANNIALTLEKSAETINNIESSTDSMIITLDNIEQVSKQEMEISKDVNSRIGEITDHTEAMVSTEGEVSEKVSKLTEKLHGEVLEIEDKMSDTNTLLERKFDEFSELLKKNNTEALVEVMKRVTEEFQKQMNDLINKLVQENFAQLNKSVEKLNLHNS